MFICNECGRKFATVRAAEAATRNGCPKCGGSDIDIAPDGVPGRSRAKIKDANGGNLPDFVGRGSIPDYIPPAGA